MKISGELMTKGALGAGVVAATSIGGVALKNSLSSAEVILTLEEANEKLKNLGLPESCKFEDNWGDKKCGLLKEEQLKKIKFEGKKENISESINNAQMTALEIKKTEDIDVFPFGIKIIFDVPMDVNIPMGNGKNIILKGNTKPEFKIVNDKLKPAWSINDFGKRIGLTGCSKDAGGSTGSCFFSKDKKINYLNNKISYIVEGDMTLEENQKIKFEEGQERYNQGFKFTVEKDIQVKKNLPLGEDVSVLPASSMSISSSGSYQIIEEEVNDKKYWFLALKT